MLPDKTRVQWFSSALFACVWTTNVEIIIEDSFFDDNRDRSRDTLGRVPVTAH